MCDVTGWKNIIEVSSEFFPASDNRYYTIVGLCSNGTVVATGTPEEISKNSQSYTGLALKKLL